MRHIYCWEIPEAISLRHKYYEPNELVLALFIIMATMHKYFPLICKYRRQKQSN